MGSGIEDVVGDVILSTTRGGHADVLEDIFLSTARRPEREASLSGCDGNPEPSPDLQIQRLLPPTLPPPHTYIPPVPLEFSTKTS